MDALARQNLPLEQNYFSLYLNKISRGLMKNLALNLHFLHEQYFNSIENKN